MAPPSEEQVSGLSRRIDDLIQSFKDADFQVLGERLSTVIARLEDHETRLRDVEKKMGSLPFWQGGQALFTAVLSTVAALFKPHP